MLRARESNPDTLLARMFCPLDTLWVTVIWLYVSPQEAHRVDSYCPLCPACFLSEARRQAAHVFSYQWTETVRQHVNVDVNVM